MRYVLNQWNKTWQHVEIQNSMNGKKLNKKYIIEATLLWTSKSQVRIFTCIYMFSGFPHSVQVLVLITSMRNHQGCQAKFNLPWFTSWPQGIISTNMLQAEVPPDATHNKEINAALLVH